MLVPEILAAGRPGKVKLKMFLAALGTMGVALTAAEFALVPVPVTAEITYS